MVESSYGISFEAIGIKSLDLVVTLDSETNNIMRPDFFAKRFEAQQNHPEAFISMAASQVGIMVGFVCCHLLQGEFGSDNLIAVLDAIAVKPDSQGQGIGQKMMKQLIGEIRDRGGVELRTQAVWNQPRVLDFFSHCGFRLAPKLILERSTREADF